MLVHLPINNRVFILNEHCGVNRLLVGGKGMFFVPPLTRSFPRGCRFFLYPHYLLTLGDPRRDYYLLANRLPTKGLCWSTFYKMFKGCNMLLSWWCFLHLFLKYGREGSTFSLMLCTLSSSLHNVVGHLQFFSSLFSCGFTISLPSTTS